MVNKGIEMPPDDESKKWTDCEEIHSLRENVNKAEVTVSVDAYAEFKDYFE